MINAIILVAILVSTNMCYETNDDYAIASRIVAGYPYVGFVNYFLCRILIVIQSFAGTVNVYVVALILLSFVAFVVITRTIFETGESIVIRGILVAVLFVFAYDHYASIQFTKTAAVVMTAGLMLLVEAVTRNKGAAQYVASIALVYIGASIRVDALIGAVGFAGIYGIVWLVRNRERLIPEGYFTGGRIALYLLLVVLVAGAYGFDAYSNKINVSTPELEYAEAYSNPRSNIVDYPTYEYYEQNKAEYDAIGITENDIYLIDRWYFDYDGAASYENLIKIDNLKRSDDSTGIRVVKSLKKCLRDIIKGVRKLSFTGIHIIMLVAIAVWFLMTTKPKNWLYLFSIGAMTGALYLAIYYMQRPTYRALYVADIGAMMWLIYYLMELSVEVRFNRIKKISGGLVALLFMLMLIPCNSNAVANYNKACGKVMSEVQAEYFESHMDSYYVWATTEKKSAKSYANPIIAPDDSDRNITSTGGWGVLSPYVLSKLEKYGLHNPIKDLINNENAYYVGNQNVSRLEEYYNRWYSETESIHFELVDTVDGQKIWRITG